MRHVEDIADFMKLDNHLPFTFRRYFESMEETLVYLTR